MIKSRIYFGVWTVLVLCLYVFSGNATGLLLLFATLLLFLWCLCSSILLKNKLTCTLTVTKMAGKGTPVQGTVAIKNTGYIPTGRVCAQLEFYNRLTGEKRRRRIFCTVGARSREETMWMMESALCGNIQVRIEKLTAFDLLGIFGSVQPAGERESAIVHPDIFPVEMEVSGGMSVDWESVRYSELKKGDDPSEVFGIREYQDGDSPKNIHWKISQKLGGLYVKELSLPVENAVLLFFETACPQGTEGKPECQAALMEAFLSCSQSLASGGYVHALGWYDQRQDRLCIEQVENEDDLAQMSQGLLALERREREFTGLHEYLQRYQEYPFGHVVWFTAGGSGEEFRQLSEVCCLSVLRCSEEENGDHLTFTPENMQEHLCRVVV